MSIRRYLILIVVALAALMLLGGGGSAIADPGSQTFFGLGDSGHLVTVDSSTAAVADVGPTGFETVSGLAIDASGSLFSTHGDPDKPGPQLITIDPVTGAGTAVGDVTDDAMALAFDSSGTLFGVNIYGDTLVTIDPSTGVFTSVGLIGLAETAHVPDIAFDSSGTLFGVTSNPGDPTRGIPAGPSELITIDPVTGTGTLVGALDPQHQVLGVAFSESGVMFGVTCDFASYLVTIDPVAASVSVVGPLGGIGPCPVRDLAASQTTSCVQQWPVTTITTIGKGQSATNNAKVSHDVTGHIVGGASEYGPTAHRINICDGTEIAAAVSDTTGTPSNTVLKGPLTCTPPGCTVSALTETAKYKSVSNDGKDTDRITLIPVP